MTKNAWRLLQDREGLGGATVALLGGEKGEFDLKMSCTPTPNGFADHYPYFLWIFHWGYTPFSDIPIWFSIHKTGEK